jgi:holo-[acyl-carrier protein] synthase
MSPSISGVGIDVVDIARFQESLDRTPALRGRLFTDNEVNLKLSSLAARFAAKEALAKALNAKTATFNWQEVEIINEPSGKPVFRFFGSLADRMEALDVHLSLSHDAGIASAIVIVEAK